MTYLSRYTSKKCPKLKEELFQFIKYVWDKEAIPENLGVANFVMLYKNKGSSDDPTKYRCIGLLNHGYKILAQIILARLLKCSDAFLKDWQAGFRAKRGCRDNAMILRTICQRMLSLGKKIAITFIDYSAAFDTVSHKFLDEMVSGTFSRNLNSYTPRLRLTPVLIPFPKETCEGVCTINVLNSGPGPNQQPYPASHTLDTAARFLVIRSVD